MANCYILAPKLYFYGESQIANSKSYIYSIIVLGHSAVTHIFCLDFIVIVYLFKVILYEMLVGQPPFLANTPAETQYKVKIKWTFRFATNAKCILCIMH